MSELSSECCGSSVVPWEKEVHFSIVIKKMVCVVSPFFFINFVSGIVLVSGIVSLNGF